RNSVTANAGAEVCRFESISVCSTPRPGASCPADEAVLEGPDDYLFLQPEVVGEVTLLDRLLEGKARQCQAATRLILFADRISSRSRPSRKFMIRQNVLGRAFMPRFERVAVVQFQGGHQLLHGRLFNAHSAHRGEIAMD